MVNLLKGISVLSYVGVKSAINVCKGCIQTATDGARVISSVCKGDYENAANIVEKRVEKTLTASVMSLYSAGKVIGKAAESIEDRSKTFLDKETINDLTTITGAFIIGGAVSASISDDDSSDISEINEQGEQIGLIPDAGTSSFYMNSQGVFVGDNYDLNSLIEIGQVENTEHVDSEDISRSEVAKNEFLNKHGLSSVPDGYEVHHIIPLSEGGADSSENMILVTEKQHDLITKAHSQFYGWHR